MDTPFELIEGTAPVSLSAPHAVPHVRSGVEKYGEPASGELVRDLCQVIKCPGIVNTHEGGEDPNNAQESPMRDAAVELAVSNDSIIHFDLHQMAPWRAQDFIIGTGKGDNINGRDDLAYVVKTILRNSGWNVEQDTLFPGRGPNTVSTRVGEEGIPAIQLEMNSSLFLPEADRYCQPRVAVALATIIISCIKMRKHRDF